MLKKITVLLLMCLPSASLLAAQLTTSDYQKAEKQLSKYTDKLVTGTVESPFWQNNRLFYKSRTQQGEQFFKVNPITQQKTLAFDHQKLSKALAVISDTEVNAYDLPFNTFTVRLNNKIAVKIKNKHYLCDLTNYLCASDTDAKKSNEMISPDGKLAVFIRDYNLWSRNLKTNKEVQLTKDGIKNFGYATNNAGWIRKDTPVVKWSPDSTKLATFKHDSRNVGDMALVSTNVGHPTIDQWKYPLPGDEHIFAIHRVVIDVKKQTVIPLDMPADPHRSSITDHVAGNNGEFLDIDWAHNSKSFAFISSSRDHKTATLKIANADNGQVKTVYSETEESFFESGVSAISWKYLDKTNEFIWFSQRSNWGHFYLIDSKTGKIKNQITRGDWTVLELLSVDEKTDTLYFTGAGREGGDPYFNYLYSINKNGKNLTLLTPEKKHHRVSMNEDSTYFLDRFSTPEQAEVSVIRKTQSNEKFTLETMDIGQLTATGWAPPTPFIVKDRNNEHDIYGLLYKPSHFDKNKSYPVVNYIYPGPQVGSIRGRHFRTARGDNQALAELGFIVIEIDALGTPGRSKSFHEFYYANMGDSGLPDQVAAIKQLAKKHSWIDIDRVGIWGHSGGGFASTKAMFSYPDFYKVAVSEAGNHDNRNYADEWGEKYHGLLVNNENKTTNYDSQANQLFADKLKGKLLLVHGTLDTNVTPYNTLMVVDALIEANKDFDMLMLPNRGHGFAREPYMVRKRWDYFVTHLMGAVPPKEFNFSSTVK
ncbi:DPP IV N-terminal domain-containing protein [Colwellia sp. UCD-KL20]|uniref:S9 family peptidase n=1 Tax=Colwellia sp. UCD-KL20 TaxID=1917165 RepID=UPI0009708697|nr:DPP IV N-terminal domain-containing protein [Colwellia sp. UCD-KL20]